ncbi:uncharacterized protein LOC114518155 [Dendronephthya gigantea]|uniref:uncharacterized protein LOC114518155 n=1 Tax=Dendronephthya gigantea TaxID=151771 RepID=UPI00106C5614|nr:uncharacterized protein LOC114518155 [Dendronephthya gigantea]
MAEEVSKLERDNTMVATAKEGEAFLEAKGGVDEDAKTRGQQKEIEDITSTEDQSDLKRTTTMAETAKEGKDLLDGEELGKTRAQTKADKNGDAQPNQNGKHDETNGKVAEADSTENGAETVAQKDETADDDEEKAAMKRTRTMEETVKEGEEYLKKKKVENDTEPAEEVKA